VTGFKVDLGAETAGIDGAFVLIADESVSPFCSDGDPLAEELDSLELPEEDGVGLRRFLLADFRGFLCFSG